MKRPYEKPTLTDLSLPTARAGWLSKGGASPDGFCNSGQSVGGTGGQCYDGHGPTNPSSCSGGTSAPPGSLCITGSTLG
jgi:hypothetical protein